MSIKIVPTLFLCCLGLFGPTCQSYGFSPLEDVWREVRRNGTYTPISQQECDTAEELFAGLLQQKDLQALKVGWEQLGFYLEEVVFQQKTYIVLRENPSQRYGRGFYIFPPENSNDNLLMIPHSFKDVGTGKIGIELVENTHFAAIAFNTVPRYTKNKDGTKTEHDLGKITDSFFVALTRAFAKVKPQGKAIQLHGFAKDNRTSKAGREAGMILSSGSKRISEDILVLQQCLQSVFSLPISIYPRDVRELGGTKNISGKTLRQFRYHGFVHIEMNRIIRDQLRVDASLRKSFADCLEKL